MPGSGEACMPENWINRPRTEAGVRHLLSATSAVSRFLVRELKEAFPPPFVQYFVLVWHGRVGAEQQQQVTSHLDLHNGSPYMQVQGVGPTRGFTPGRQLREQKQCQIKHIQRHRLWKITPLLCSDLPLLLRPRSYLLSVVPFQRVA